MGNMKPVLITCLSVGGSLCASFSAGNVNVFFAVLAAILGAVTLLWTSTPHQAGTTTTGAPPRYNSIVAGITAGAISFILLQVMQVCIGIALGFGLAALRVDPTGEVYFVLLGFLTIALLVMKLPVDLMLGANLIASSEKIRVALLSALIFLAVADIVSITMAMSMGLPVEISFGQALLGFVLRVGLAILGIALGGYGVRFVAQLTTRTKTQPPQTAMT
jgi:hypothetical protein